jgi:uncharacterized protein (TIGR01777 family)
MKVLITGSSGLIGSALIPRLEAGGHKVVRLVRTEPTGRNLGWHPERGEIHLPIHGGFDAVVHLAGENLASGRWSARKKAQIYDSRVQGTRLLVGALTKLDPLPRVLLSASAMGYYGDRGDEIVDERMPPGDDFMARLCQEWEAATDPAREAGIRVVHLRNALIMGREAILLKRLLLPFKLGLGATIGSGAQYMGWIAIDDVVRVIEFVLVDDSFSGPVNVAAPNPVTNREFTRTLGRVLGRPAFLRVPAFALRLVYGDLVDAVLLVSIRMLSRRLRVLGFEFQYPQLEGTLRHVLGR